MADDRDPPILNPVLSLQMEPAPESRRGGGKGRDSIVRERLEPQQRTLLEEARSFYSSRAELSVFADKTHLDVRMFSDSLAPSYTPDGLFSTERGCRLVAPLRKGYLVEVDLHHFRSLVEAIRRPPNYAVQVDISRVSGIKAFDQQACLRDHSVDDLWEAAPEAEEGRFFIMWFAPFRERTAREELIARIAAFSNSQALLPVFPATRLPASTEETEQTLPAATPRQSSVARAMRSYRNTGVGRATVRVPSREHLAVLAASGTTFRIDPVRRLQTAADPGEGAHPPPPLELDGPPVVAVIDGGLHAQSYKPAEAWCAPPLFSDDHADRQHGNEVSSLAVHAHAWNNNRDLPALNCRIGTVQAVPNRQGATSFNESQLVEYLEQVARTHPDARVWNISANQNGFVTDPEDVSALGHELALLARKYNFLPVISIGNAGTGNAQRPSPPADCEAAIVVGGREADADGNPSQACPVCLQGPGPDGMLKPDLSWFSNLRMLGGITRSGSSYATPLVSSLATHAFAALRDPTPDVVKALCINAAELEEHDPALGWGTPYNGHMPWVCAPGSVTLAWRAHLEPGTAYYWNDIPVSPELVRNGKLYGKAHMTAVLDPLVSPFGGANYFSSRLETSFQYLDRSEDKWISLLGSMRESTISESAARSDLKKWQPIRRHCRNFTQRGGLQFGGESLRVYARIYTRDLFQFGWSHHSQAGSQEAAFVLTLWSGDNQSSIFDSTVQRLGNFVESAVIEQEIEQEIER